MQNKQYEIEKTASLFVFFPNPFFLTYIVFKAVHFQNGPIIYNSEPPSDKTKAPTDD